MNIIAPFALLLCLNSPCTEYNAWQAWSLKQCYNAAKTFKEMYPESWHTSVKCVRWDRKYLKARNLQ